MNEKTASKMLKWVKFMGMQDAKEVVEDAVSHEDDEKEEELRIAYELTNGENSSTDIASRISVSQKTVSNWQKKWSKRGIADKDGKQSSYEHLISLEELGLECPEIPGENEEGGETDE
jgi:predicted transcriptional regulator